MAKITLGGDPANTNGNLPANGSTIKDHTLTKRDMSLISLSEQKGKKVVLNIFPSVDTAVCAASVRAFNEKAASLDNTVVICISKDLPFAQERFCSAEGIENVVVASDFRDPSFAEELGVVLTDSAFAGLNARAIVVLDEQGKVTYSELVSEVGEEPNYEAAIAAL